MPPEIDRRDELMEQLYLKLYPLFVRYAGRKTNNHAIAEELADEAFAVACEHRLELYNSDNPERWLTTTLKFILHNYARRQERCAAIFCDNDITDFPSPASALDLKDLYAGIVAEPDLDLIIAVDVDGRTCLDMSRQLGISAEACYKRLQRAEQKFKENYKKFVIECPETRLSVHCIKGGKNHVE